MQYLSAICLICLILDSLTTIVIPLQTEPYCNKNVTVTSHKIVTKTRLKTVTKKGFFNKLAQKKEIQVEVYADYEPVHKLKVELGCCEGYKLNAFYVCEPQCIENGCPLQSRCVAPEVCECRLGYMSKRSEKDGKYICEPICERDCPQHSECVGPNQCACKQGYRVTDDKLCKPHCESGCGLGECVAPNKCECPLGYKFHQNNCVDPCDYCQFGTCMSDHICICNDGLKWNRQLLKCEAISNQNDWETTTYYTDITEVQDYTVYSSITTETENDTDKDDIDPNEMFDEIISSTTYDPLENSSPSHEDSKKHKCPDDYVYLKGQCHALKFASNDVDCRFKPCEDAHSTCLENGTCVCMEGYKWFKMHVVDHDSLKHSIKAICLTTAEYASRLQQQQLDAENKHTNESGSSWTTIFFIVLGILVIVSALVFLGFKLLRTQTGRLDVEGKNLSCSYDSRACAETEKSVI